MGAQRPFQFFSILFLLIGIGCATPGPVDNGSTTPTTIAYRTRQGSRTENHPLLLIFTTAIKTTIGSDSERTVYTLTSDQAKGLIGELEDQGFFQLPGRRWKPPTVPNDRAIAVVHANRIHYVPKDGVRSNFKQATTFTSLEKLLIGMSMNLPQFEQKRPDVGKGGKSLRQ